MKSTNPTGQNSLRALQDYGQAVWLDYIRKNLIQSGELKRLIEEDGLKGLTSNPAIFEKAIQGSLDYQKDIAALSSKCFDPQEVYERLAVCDIQDAADLLQSVYEQTGKRDGYVSLEVSPLLAQDTLGTIEEARRLWKTVNRDNLMVKVPATPEGIPAIETLIAEGININVTLLFSQRTYVQVAEAYLAGLERRAVRGEDLTRMASVASFFVSRIDSAVDGLLSHRLKNASDRKEKDLLRSLKGKVAIANAKLTYKQYQEIFSSKRWQKLADQGAHTQRILWASTGTKNPNYRDVRYVEELIGPDTVNTIPPATLEAFRDHGQPRLSLSEDITGVRSIMETLTQVGISLDEVTDKLLEEGIGLFVDPYEKLLQAIQNQCRQPQKAKINLQTYVLPEKLAKVVEVSLEDWQRNRKVRLLWARDAALWTNTDEAHWLDWLGIIEDQLAHLKDLQDLAEEMKGSGFTQALLLGMGGSSLCPEVLKMTFGKRPGYPDLHVLDSTDPAQIKTVEAKLDLTKTIFIVSSKSGGTLEPNIFKQYFFERVKKAVGQKEAGNQFIAVTDSGSKMQAVGEKDRFRHIFFGVPGIGGRYSALSNFGLVPAAIIGIDLTKFLERAQAMVQTCSTCVPASENPGVVLGVILGTASNQGRDKVTIIVSPGLHNLGAWLEQLLAESTGKEGKGLIPVDREPLGSTEVYGRDRLFIYIRLAKAPDDSQDAAVAAFEQAGHPVVRITVDEIYGLGEEFFRWEFATAVAGSILGINPFDQPDVEASKIETRKLTTTYEETGRLLPKLPFFEEEGLQLFTDETYATLLNGFLNRDRSIAGYLRAHLDQLKPGDYFALLAYLEMNELHEELLQTLRKAVRNQKRVATCLGFGPRFLHSTGQAYKGGPNTGVFLQITCEDAVDLPVPGQKYTFGLVKAAQAQGDFQVLAERGRRVLRVHLGRDPESGLQQLAAYINQALSVIQ
ncbi:MAG: bifunctional transaldolase/phosoglucose isomerase [Deltaproteobacteria bacterium]|nr:bifunctional transaldolase/phosoglucose isomerase [Deltaproteobacteria bacterium]